MNVIATGDSESWEGRLWVRGCGSERGHVESERALYKGPSTDNRLVSGGAFTRVEHKKKSKIIRRASPDSFRKWLVGQSKR